ncbi:hypothetical protein GOODEAATRI_027748 [Goodea atripinnis]|uniref:Uncharacterized protein n=1 Tax=Goodea atripinnis TaxID=208336 RepID=A0ABV0P8D8_9TELE
MEKLGIHRMPPEELLVAAHLHHGCKRPPKTPHCHPRQTVFKSALTERAYKAAAVAVRAPTVSSMLSAYQAELCKDMATKPDPDVWDEITSASSCTSSPALHTQPQSLSLRLSAARCSPS